MRASWFWKQRKAHSARQRRCNTLLFDALQVLLYAGECLLEREAGVLDPKYHVSIESEEGKLNDLNTLPGRMTNWGGSDPTM